MPNAHPNGVVSPDETAPPASGSEFAPFGSFEMDQSFPDAGHPGTIDEDDTDDEDDATDFQPFSVHRGPADSDDDSDDDDNITGYAGYSSYNAETVRRFCLCFVTTMLVLTQKQHATTSSVAPFSIADTRSITSRVPLLDLDDGQASQSSASKFPPYKQFPSTSNSRAGPSVSRPDALRNFSGTGSARNTSTMTASVTTSQQTPAPRAGVRTPYLPPHLRGDNYDYHDPFNTSTTLSVVTDDLGTGSGSVASSLQHARRPWVAPQQFNAYGPDGQLQRREADVQSVQTRSSATVSSGPPGYGIRRRPDRGNWARPDRRKQFDHKVTFATSNDNIVDIYDSGSADEL